jgi:hypothetical protein
VYHPQTQGAVEVFNKYIKPKLHSKLTECAARGEPQQWSELLPAALKRYNETPSSVTKQSPALLFLGRVRVDGDTELPRFS